MLPPIKPFLDHKRLARLSLTAERQSAKNARPDAGLHAARMFIENIPLPQDVSVALYYPIKTELDTGPLLDALVERKIEIALPVMGKKNAPLSFRRFQMGDALQKGRFGVKEPEDSAPLVSPSIIVTPLLGFTRAGGRLGYGGGYYDRTLANLRKTSAVLAVGFGYGAQEVDALPLSPLDQPLDWIVTERGAIRT